MEMSELLESYSAISETKSGFLMTSGKCIYLYNSYCCEAVCRRILLRAGKTELMSDKSCDLFVYRHGSEISAYSNLKRLLGLTELIILYEIPSENGGLYGVFAYEKDKRLMDSHFTDSRISELIDSFAVGENNSRPIVSEQLKQLEQAVSSGEVSALNQIYIKGKKIQDGGIL